MAAGKVATSITNRTYTRLKEIVSTWKKSQASSPCAWVRRNARQDVSTFRRTGSCRLARKIRRTVAEAVQGIKGCWAPDAGQARKTMHRIWPNDSIPGEAAQLLPLPRHFGQLAQLITEDMVSAPCGPDPEPYVRAIKAYEQAGFDEV